ncbi:sulfotransferase domain-containing protein [Candidatus Sumerlaeota bacterium]|nr:sulfotransferase domain-containing protein [Candidatus Sumerlaeota bacterium]
MKATTTPRRPDFIIVGAPKCGTTALCQYLRDHPQIFIPKIKEPHFFSDDMPGHRTVNTEEEYLKFFRTATDRHIAAGEGSVLSIYSSVALQNIKAFKPDIKIIFMLRNPADLVYSFYAQLLYTLEEDALAFEQAWALQEERMQGRSLPPRLIDTTLVNYRNIGMLGEHAERVLQVFGREKVLFLLQDDLHRDSRAVYENTLSFLGVPSDGRTDFPRVNQSHANRSLLLANFIRRAAKLQAAARRALDSELLDGDLVTRLNPLNYLRRMNLRVERRPPMNPDTRKMLQKTFADDIQKLSKLLDIPLDHWLD